MKHIIMVTWFIRTVYLPSIQLDVGLLQKKFWKGVKMNKIILARMTNTLILGPYVSNTGRISRIKK
jgi:hypothetical protein